MAVTISCTVPPPFFCAGILEKTPDWGLLRVGRTEALPLLNMSLKSLLIAFMPEHAVPVVLVLALTFLADIRVDKMAFSVGFVPATNSKTTTHEPSRLHPSKLSKRSRTNLILRLGEVTRRVKNLNVLPFQNKQKRRWIVKVDELTDGRGTPQSSNVLCEKKYDRDPVKREREW
ncbi:hypothetical protein RUM44_009955 [Polyplax serrata]|uniref:Uncharacterized protein n=1 Tax=Polyplax serrata TaxID=468196 RepID=A0ABR1AU51_POLSC